MQKEPHIEAFLIETYSSETDDAIGFAPIGFDEPYRIIVQNNPVNFVDPKGLEIFFGQNWLRFLQRFEMPPPPENWPKPPGWSEEWQWRYPEGTSGKCPQPRWFDPKNGEWRWHEVDPYHPDGHWDYNPWDQWNSPWQNVSPSGILPIIPPGGFSNDCYKTGMCT